MKKIEIIPLSKSESGQLTGGFNCVNGVDTETEIIFNGNCATESGWWNSNCSCQACKETEIDPIPKPKQ